MSYDLAVWVGTRPATNSDASDEYERRMDAMEVSLESAGEPPAPSEEIRRFVEAALARYPGLDENSGPECPWASSPLMGEAVGDLIYFPMTFSGSEYARDVLADIANTLGLVCYDPQIEGLLPDASAASAGSIAASADAALRQHMQTLQRPNSGAGMLGRLFRRK